MNSPDVSPGRFHVRLARRVWHTAVFWAFAGTAVRVLGFAVVTALALRLLPSEEIGFWYLLTGLGGLAASVEMCLGSTISRLASYYYGGAASVPSLGFVCVPAAAGSNLAALAGLMAMARRLYRRLALAVLLLLLVGGGAWLGLLRRPPALSSFQRQTAFVVYGIGSAAAMAGLFWPQLLFGLNRVRDYHVLLLESLVLQYGISFVGLLSGAGVIALVAGQLGGLLYLRWKARPRVLAGFGSGSFDREQPVRMLDVWPMAWRSGAAALGSFLCIQNNTLICADTAGLTVAASFGLSLQVALLLHGFAGNWLAVKFPQISAARAAGRAHELRRLIRLRMLLGMATYVAGSVVILGVLPTALTLLRSRTAVLPFSQLAALLAVVGLDLVVGMHAAILQTGNEVPYLRAFVISGVCTLVMGLVLGSTLGVWGIILAPFLAQLPLNYWWTPYECWKRLRLELEGPNTMGKTA